MKGAFSDDDVCLFVRLSVCLLPISTLNLLSAEGADEMVMM